MADSNLSGPGEQTIEVVGLVEDRLPRCRRRADVAANGVARFRHLIAVLRQVVRIDPGEVELTRLVARDVCAVAARARRRRDHRLARAEQPRCGLATVVEHPSERDDHRISVPSAQDTGTVRHRAIE